MPNKLPITGTKIKAIKSEEVKTNIIVMGKYFINCPTIPGQNNNGRKTIKVVAVDEVIGQNILDAPSLYA